ncbi:hypothetical protein Hdeb2414_s0003g00101621 [Helianthus debilis subsp. tardiflorus]
MLISRIAPNPISFTSSICFFENLLTVSIYKLGWHLSSIASLLYLKNSLCSVLGCCTFFEFFFVCIFDFLLSSFFSCFFFFFGGGLTKSSSSELSSTTNLFLFLLIFIRVDIGPSKSSSDSISTKSHAIVKNTYKIAFIS